MSEVEISFRCPGCARTIVFAGSLAGTVQDCPKCGGWVDVPELTCSTPLDDPYEKEQSRLWADAQRQSEEQDRLIEQGRRNQQEWQRQMEQSALYQNQAEESFRRFALLLERWERLTDKIELLARLGEQSGS